MMFPARLDTIKQRHVSIPRSTGEFPSVAALPRPSHTYCFPTAKSAHLRHRVVEIVSRSDFSSQHPAHVSMGRREVLSLAPAGLILAGAKSASAAVNRSKVAEFDAAWVTEATSAGTEFAIESYESMRDDASRTPKFVEAIQQRLKGKEGRLSVVDIGTGPFAILAIAAANAGARKVYAIEADPVVAQLAREAIVKAGVPNGTIEVLQGYSTDVTLPEKVDLLVAEVIGSVATEEGVYRTLRDAQERFLLTPSNAASYIPQRVQTMVAPAAYAFHYMIAAEGRKAAGLLSDDGPIRLNCQDTTLALLDEPQIYEDFRYNDLTLPSAGLWNPKNTLTFTVSSKKLAENTQMYISSLGFDGVPRSDAKLVSQSVASGFSGVAMWPRLILDADEKLVVEARGPRGVAQKSHWQTVLPLMAPAPVPVVVGDTVDVSGSALFDQSKPAAYTLHAKLTRN